MSKAKLVKFINGNFKLDKNQLKLLLKKLELHDLTDTKECYDLYLFIAELIK